MVNFIRSRGGIAFVGCLVIACSKESGTAATPTATAAVTSAPTPPQAVLSAVPTNTAGAVSSAPTAAPSASAPPMTPPSAVASAPATSSAAALPTAAALSSVAASASATPTASPTATATPIKYASSRVSGDNFSVDLIAPSECTVGATCVGKIVLHASAPFHVNDEYPYKFTMDESANLEAVAPGAVFSKKDGHFTKTSATQAELAVTVKGKAAGAGKIAGQFRMSVCAEAKCQVESPKLSLAVLVK